MELVDSLMFISRVFYQVASRFMKVWARCTPFDELLNDLHHTVVKVSTIRRRPPHGAIVVAGVHRTCALGIKGTHL